MPVLMARPGLMVDVVLHAVAPRDGDPELAGRVIGVEQPGLAGELAVRRDDQVALTAGQRYPGEEPLVGFLEYDPVLSDGGADQVPPDPVRPPGIIDGHVEQRRSIP